MNDYIPENLKRWTRPECFIKWADHWAYTSECFVFLGRHRGSDLLTEVNFRVALDALGGKSDTVQVIREGCSLVGWIEWIAIHESDPEALREADEIVEYLADACPVLDDEALSDAEFEAAYEYWGNEPVSGRIELCRDAGVSIFAARSDALDPDVFDFIRDSVIS